MRTHTHTVLETTHTHVWRVRRRSLCTCERRKRLSFWYWGTSPRHKSLLKPRSSRAPITVTSMQTQNVLMSLVRLTFVLRCHSHPGNSYCCCWDFFFFFVCRAIEFCCFRGWLIRPMPIFRSNNTRDYVAHFIYERVINETAKIHNF